MPITDEPNLTFALEWLAADLRRMFPTAAVTMGEHFTVDVALDQARVYFCVYSGAIAALASPLDGCFFENISEDTHGGEGATIGDALDALVTTFTATAMQALQPLAAVNALRAMAGRAPVRAPARARLEREGAASPAQAEPNACHQIDADELVRLAMDGTAAEGASAAVRYLLRFLPAMADVAQLPPEVSELPPEVCEIDGFIAPGQPCAPRSPDREKGQVA